MKSRIDQILLVTFLITAVLYVVFLLIWLDIIPRPFYDPEDPFRFSGLWAFGGVWFHAVPCFCLQLLVCRTAERPILRLIPVLLLVGLAAWFVVELLISTGLDPLVWVVALSLCIAPAVGFALAWAVYGIGRAFLH